MAESIIGINLGKLKFHVCVFDTNGHVERHRSYSRSAVMRFLSNTLAAVMAIEAFSWFA